MISFEGLHSGCCVLIPAIEMKSMNRNAAMNEMALICPLLLEHIKATLQVILYGIVVDHKENFLMNVQLFAYNSVTGGRTCLLHNMAIHRLGIRRGAIKNTMPILYYVTSRTWSTWCYSDPIQSVHRKKCA